MKLENFNFLFPLRVRFCETDPHGHVFNANYHVYFDVAITEYFRLLRLRDVLVVQDCPYVFHVKKTMAEYCAPAYFDEEILVGVKTQKVGTTSLVFSLAVFSKEDQQLITIGEVVWIYVNTYTREKHTLPKELIATINKFETYSI